MDLKTGEGSAGRGEPSQSPDVTLTMDSDNFFAMFSGNSNQTYHLRDEADVKSKSEMTLKNFIYVCLGKLKPASAFVLGKLRISGDLQKAMKLEKLMNLLKSKL